MANPTRFSSLYSEALPVDGGESITAAMVSAKAFDEKIESFQNENDDDDSCCICFEPFTSHDPANITSCKHEYHLQCILEWSQRSKECPICLQDFVLKDPASQELLAALEKDRHLTSRAMSSAVYGHHPHQHLTEDLEDAYYSEEYDFDDYQRRSFLASRGHTILRDRDLSFSTIPRDSDLSFSAISRDRELSFRLDHSQGSVFPDTESELSVHLAYSVPSEDGSSEGDSHVSGMLSPILIRGPVSISQPPPNLASAISANKDGALKHRIPCSQSASDSPQRPSSSDTVSFSESLKSKFSAASARYKESISKGTRGFREKLLARNSSVKELSKGVQREMNAGIAGVARMIERLDLKSKQSSRAVSASGFTGGTSSIPSKGKAVLENVVWPADNSTEEPVPDLKLGTPCCIKNNASSCVDVSYAQRRH